MPLGPGAKLGPYEVLAPLGAGGMGEVYRARDPRLGRDIAIKLLPAEVAQDAELLARFRREAQLLASLNHPHVASVHGLEELDGKLLLVMELVEGEDLAERLKRGAIPVDEALDIAKQVAEALEEAHEHGIVHRDLKPANSKLTPEGKVKVLDFGLAKAYARDQATNASDTSHSPTMTRAGSESGVILGTAAYMSPEQARGKPVDKRADIWAFGVVLFEMLTGSRLFHGETTSDTLAAVLQNEPDWDSLPAATPGLVRSLLRRCLQKDRKRRLHDIADARIEIEEVLGGHATSRRGLALRSWAGIAMGVVLAAVAVVALWISRPRPTSGRPLRRFTVPVAPAESLAVSNTPSMAIAPDGSRLVYEGKRGNGSGLYSRRFDRLEAEPIPGTEDACGPFFSHDGRWIGFVQGGKLQKQSTSDGVPSPLCSVAQDLLGAAWSPSGTIFFTPGLRYGLWKVSPSGGMPEVLTRPDAGKREKTHRWPEVLPGGKAILFTTGTSNIDSFDEARIEAQLVPSGERRVLVEGGMCGRYAASGHLVYARDNALFAVPFDPVRIETRGSPVRVLDDVMTFPENGFAQYSFSADGTLVYARGRAPHRSNRLLSVDREGRTTPLPLEPRRFWDVRVSPAGDRAVMAIDGANSHLWLYDMSRGTLARLTFEWDNIAPIWTPDGRRVTFGWAGKGGNTNIYWQQVDGSGPAERLTSGVAPQIPGSWTPDGKTLVFTERGAASRSDIWLLSLDGGRAPEPLLKEAFNERSPWVSPDGRWLAYVSDETGRNQVYLRPFRTSGGKLQISTDGGRAPVWARDGSEIFYQNDDRIMAVALTTRPDLRAAKPRVLFHGDYVHGDYFAFDVAPDGRFVMVESNQGPTVTHLEVVLNWFEELKARVPAGR